MYFACHFYHISVSFPSPHAQNCYTLTNGICGLPLWFSVGTSRAELEDSTQLLIIQNDKTEVFKTPCSLILTSPKQSSSVPFNCTCHFDFL